MPNQMRHCLRSRTVWAGASLLAACLLLAGSALADAAGFYDARDQAVRATVDTGLDEIEYDAIVNRLTLHDDDREPIATFVSFAYLRTDVDDASERPVAFFFNGGPGSASVWLHLGFAAPVRLPLDLGDHAPGEPGPALSPNARTLLDVTDLVYIDPVGTGFSAGAGAAPDERYWNVRGDAESIARVVRAFLHSQKRDEAPIFLAGESYGGVRAAAMLEPLLSGPDPLDVRGVILISPALDRDVIVRRSSMKGVSARLATFAATAWRHEMLPVRPDDLGAFLEDVDHFASREYLEALRAGDDLPLQERRRLADLLHAMTGVSPEAILQNDLRVTPRLFRQAVRERTGGVPDQFDGRALTNGGRGMPVRIFGRALREHLARTWRIDTDGEYILFNPQANRAWTTADGRRRFFEVDIETLDWIEAAQERRPSLGVFIATGVYDQATPFAAARRELASSDLNPAQTTLHEYESGHMVYLDDESFEAMSDDVRRFIQRFAVPPAAATDAVEIGAAAPAAP